MTKKQIFFVFLAMLAGVLLTALLFEIVIRRQRSLLPPEAVTPSVQYAFGVVCAASTLVGVFLALRQTGWNPLLRLSLITSPAVLVLIDYYLLGERNFLFCLPLLAVAFFILLHRVMQD